MESTTISVGRDLRIKLPQSLLQLVNWIGGNQPVDGWLLVGSPGRCRLLSAAEVDSDPRLQALQARIAAEVDAATVDALEFRDEATMSLALRLMPIQISPPAPGWRLTLPRVIAAIMQIRPGESELGALFVQGHIELWTVEELRSAVTHALTEII